MEAARQARIAAGMKQIDENFSGFDSDFYDKRRQAYTEYQMPQLADDYERTSKNLGYSLARTGLLNSSTGVQKEASLAKEMDKAKRTVADQGQTEVNNLRGKVEDSRSMLVSQLEASADPQAIGGLALAQSAQYRDGQTFTQPLGRFFDDWSSIYLGGEQAAAYGGNSGSSIRWPGLSGGSSSRVVR
jgi:hypothetical protein